MSSPRNEARGEGREALWPGWNSYGWRRYTIWRREIREDHCVEKRRTYFTRLRLGVSCPPSFFPTPDPTP